MTSRAAPRRVQRHVYIYIYIYIYIYNICVYIYIYIYNTLYIYITDTSICVYIYIYTYIYIYIYITHLCFIYPRRDGGRASSARTRNRNSDKYPKDQIRLCLAVRLIQLYGANAAARLISAEISERPSKTTAAEHSVSLRWSVRETTSYVICPY